MTSAHSASPTLADNILNFHKSIAIQEKLPSGVEIMNPYQQPEAFALASLFYNKYYNDVGQRTMIVGINPGRFGGGITGIPFTDPIKLEKYCGIKNNLQKKPELSADFIYRMILAFGGPGRFYQKFYISAISPLGFTKDGKNLNYYDIPELQRALRNFIVHSFRTQLNFGLSRELCFCLGEGQNFKFLMKLNEEYKFFSRIVPLPHPRFIMQYRRKKVDDFVKKYVDEFNTVA